MCRIVHISDAIDLHSILRSESLPRDMRSDERSERRQRSKSARRRRSRVRASRMD
jgi:hypothetical protein